MYPKRTLSVALLSGNGVWARGLTSSDEPVAAQEIAQLFQLPDTEAPEERTGGASRGQNDVFAPRQIVRHQAK